MSSVPVGMPFACTATSAAPGSWWGSHHRCLFVQTTKLFIGGKWIESETDNWLDVHNPVRGDRLDLTRPSAHSGLIWNCLVGHERGCYPGTLRHAG